MRTMRLGMAVLVVAFGLAFAGTAGGQEAPPDGCPAGSETFTEPPGSDNTICWCPLDGEVVGVILTDGTFQPGVMAGGDGDCSTPLPVDSPPPDAEVAGIQAGPPAQVAEADAPSGGPVAAQPQTAG